MTDSIYDQLNAYGTVAKQRFVENFTGYSLNTDRWNTSNPTGTGTTDMSDSIDGGASVATQSGVNNHTEINFNGKRQYSPTASVVIGVTTQLVTSSDLFCGFGSGVNTLDPQHSLATMTQMNPSGWISLQTSDGSNTGLNEVYSTVTAKAFGADAWKIWKIENVGSTCNLYISGVLDVTTSTKTPSSAMQPVIGARARSSNVATTRVRYMEAYNT
jgi:hypothetical protein